MSNNEGSAIPEICKFPSWLQCNSGVQTLSQCETSLQQTSHKNT